MTVLLPADEVTLYPPGGLDAHGWRLPPTPGTDPYWQGTGNLQLAAGISDPHGAAGGGRGPHGPARDLTGQLYVPAGFNLTEGSVAVIRDRVFVLSQARLVRDPAGAGLDCQVATVTSTDTWPQGDPDAD